MTYVSRRTRITVSRWLDECDAEYRLRLCRCRSDGRLKKYSSSEDLRAWVNDNCMKHEYLVDLMSDGEVSDEKPFRLYGRFIPVPILFQLVQNSNTIKEKDSTENQNLILRGCKSTTNECDTHLKSAKVNRLDNSCQSSAPVLPKTSGLNTAQWEKNQLQKNLVECTLLLNRAVEKLEKIQGIITCNKEQKIQEDYSKVKVSCSYSVVSSSNNSECVSSTRSYIKNLKDSIKYTELLRKISNLRAKLKKVQECRQEVNMMIRNSKQRVECASSHQLTELFSRQEEANVKRLQKKLEKLIAERGRLLSEMCDALTTLNNIKKSSVNFRRKNSQTIKNTKNSECRKIFESSACACGCRSCMNESSDTMRSHGSESSLLPSNNESETQKQKEHRFFCKKTQRGPCLGENNSKSKNCNYAESKYSTCGSSTGGFSESAKRSVSKTKEKKSKVQFVCPQSSCKKKIDADDISDFPNAFTPQQQAVISGILQNIQQLRPSTTPTTKREWRETSSYPRGRCNFERRAKSETTMKDIEKTLRNYECRLNFLDDLDRRVEDVKEKLSESLCLRKNLEKMKAEAQMQREADREKSERQMTKLYTENWELKRQVERLTVKFNAQTKKIQSLKCGVLKARELEMGWECQAQELKKKLSEYQEGFEHQRKCISKWESVVAEQRTEIENLMNHIRMLTKMRNEDTAKTVDKNCLQKSRSYIQDVPYGRRASNRTKTQSATVNPPNVNDCSCCCPNYQNPFNGQMYQQGKYNAGHSLGRNRCN